MASRLLPAIQQVFSNIGEIGIGFKLKTYATLTLTPLATYSDEALTIPNANPASGATTGNQISDGNGRFGDMWVDNLESYKIVLTDEDDATIDVADPVDGGSSGSLTVFNPIPEAFWGTTGGTSSAYTLDSNVDISDIGYQDTQIFEVDFHIANAGAATMAIDGLTALNLKKKTGQGTKVDLLVGDVLGTHLIRNDGTDLVVLNPRTILTYLGAPPTLTVATNTLTLTNAASSYNINTASGAQTINTVEGLVSGQTVVIGITSASNAATFTSGIGNVVNPGGISITLSTINDKITLYYDGTNAIVISVSSAGATPIQLLETKVASASATIDFSSVITSTFSKYIIELIGVTPATDATWLGLRFSIDGGATFITANYTGGYGIYQDTGAAVAANTGLTDRILLTADDTASPNRTVDNGAANGINGQIVITNPSSSTKYKTAQSQICYDNNNGDFSTYSTSGRYEGGTQVVNGFRLLFNTGAIATGIINLYGMK